jgi:hypothetical protein
MVEIVDWTCVGGEHRVLTGLAAQASWTKACSVLSSEEFQRAYGINPQIGIIPDDPTETEMAVGPHCDISRGSITLFTKKAPSADLDGMLKATKADEYRRAGLLAVFVGPRIVALTMDAHGDEPAGDTQPKLESLAKLALPRLK